MPTTPADGHAGTLPQDAAEIVRRVDRTFGQRGWSQDAYRRLVTGGMVPALARAPEPEGDDSTETVAMDAAVAAVAGVVAGMIRWDEQEERRHRRRLEQVARGGGPGSPLPGMSTRSLVAGALRRAAVRARGTSRVRR